MFNKVKAASIQAAFIILYWIFTITIYYFKSNTKIENQLCVLVPLCNKKLNLQKEGYGYK